ncbi:T9SS type A sorting domain-containing protein [Haliscomenobacter sp.]|uniref:T9SS type A sorting domain-containing protein n=1 Tax=Haliscomenobacter sp. TaxID=2717303 RepID=UPI003BAB4D4F
MKNLCTFLTLFILHASPIQAQFTYSGGPEDLKISQIVGIGDTLMTVVGNEVYFKEVSKNTNWQPIHQGLFGKDTSIFSLGTLRDKFFVVQGNAAFFLPIGMGSWQKTVTTGIWFENLPQYLVSVGNRELLLNTFNKKEGRYYFYHYDETNNEWNYVEALDNENLGMTYCITPSGNIVAYVEVVYGLCPSECDKTREMVVFNASTREWSNLGRNDPALFNNVVALSDTVLLGTGPLGIARSTDGGRRWSAFGLSGKMDAYLYHSENTLYVVGTNGVAQSRNNGQSWKKISAAPQISKTTPFVAKDTLAWMVLSGVPYQIKKIGSIDSTEKIQIPASAYITGAIKQQQSLFFLGLGGVFKLDLDSTQSLKSQNSTAGLPKLPQSVYALQKTESGLFSIAGLGFYAQLPGREWALSLNNIQLTSASLLHRGLSARKDTVLIFGENPTYYSFDRGQNWQQVPSPSIHTMKDFTDVNNVLIAGFPYDPYFTFTNGHNFLYRWDWKNPSWQKINTDEFGMHQFGMKGDTIIKQSGEGRWFYSKNYTNWTDIGYHGVSKLFSLSSGIYSYAISADPVNPTIVATFNANGTKRELLRIPDNGVKFITGKDSLLVIIPNPPTSPAANRDFVLFSSNLGKTWKKLVTTQIGKVNTALFDDNQLCLGGSNGVWCAPLSNLLTGLFDPQPLVSHVLRVYPNPGEGLFQLNDPQKSMSGTVFITVYNLQGQLIQQAKTNVYDFSLSVDLSQQFPGQYWILINDQRGEKVWVAKVIKQ